jgi:hypothetical protein
MYFDPAPDHSQGRTNFTDSPLPDIDLSKVSDEEWIKINNILENAD